MVNYTDIMISIVRLISLLNKCQVGSQKISKEALLICYRPDLILKLIPTGNVKLTLLITGPIL